MRSLSVRGFRRKINAARPALTITLKTVINAVVLTLIVPFFPLTPVSWVRDSVISHTKAGIICHRRDGCLYHPAHPSPQTSAAVITTWFNRLRNVEKRPWHPFRICTRIRSLCHAWRPALFCLCTFGSGVRSTGVESKFLVTLPFVVLLHFLNRFSYGRTRRAEHPCACRTCPALKIPCFNPHDVPTHTPTIPLTAHLLNIDHWGRPVQWPPKGVLSSFLSCFARGENATRIRMCIQMNGHPFAVLAGWLP